MSDTKKWYRVTVYGTGSYTELVQADSAEAAEDLVNDGEGTTLEETSLNSVDGMEVEEATDAEIAQVHAAKG